jgi:pimeloyl-ACP methyl ester carboxylesterase
VTTTGRRVVIGLVVTPFVAALLCCLSSVALLKSSPATLRRVIGTNEARRNPPQGPPVEPPPTLFERITYDAPLGKNWAYVTPVRPGPRRPAIVYLTGGFVWDIDEGSWEAAPADNDQSGRAFREAGLVVMRPSLRGTHDNPGKMECFFGEVDDVVAAAVALAARPDVDPERIYVAGHSTGASLALLAAESCDLFRGVIAFGAAGGHATSCVSRGASVVQLALRSPTTFMSRLHGRALLIEGRESPNVAYLRVFTGPQVSAVAVNGLDHFAVLGPASELVAKALVGDTGPEASFSVSANDIEALARTRQQSP